MVRGESHGRERPVCSKCGRVHFQDPKVAVVVFTTQDERVLMVKRSTVPHQGCWTLPAGFVDAGEDPKVAATREVLEETGLKIQITELVDVLHSTEYDRGADILIVYKAEVLGGEIKAQDDAWAAGFFPEDEIPELGFEVTKLMISRWKQGAL
jgi:ADP-ribose pyrophosphatase YjhB (NUDIX family)